jgi:hypothetical protein
LNGPFYNYLPYKLSMYNLTVNEQRLRQVLKKFKKA